MTFRLPAALQSDDDRDAIKALKRYYGPMLGQSGFYTGSLFDAWDSTGTRADDTNRFTSDDLVAVRFLSVDVQPKAAYQLLVDRADEFSELLGAVGPDRDLADEADPVVDDNWPGWQLTTALRTLPKVGPTKASKLIARKRPRLRPIFDSVVAAVTNTAKHQWEPMRLALPKDDQVLHHRLLRLRDAAGLPQHISALRVLDVIT